MTSDRPWYGTVRRKHTPSETCLVSGPLPPLWERLDLSVAKYWAVVASECGTKFSMKFYPTHHKNDSLRSS